MQNDNKLSLIKLKERENFVFTVDNILKVKIFRKNANVKRYAIHQFIQITPNALLISHLWEVLFSPNLPITAYVFAV